MRLGSSGVGAPLEIEPRQSVSEFGVTGAAPADAVNAAQLSATVVTHSTLKSRTRRPITSFTADLQCRVRPDHPATGPVPAPVARSVAGGRAVDLGPRPAIVH